MKTYIVCWMHFSSLCYYNDMSFFLVRSKLCKVGSLNEFLIVALNFWSSAKMSLNRDLSLNKVSLNQDCTVFFLLIWVHLAISKQIWLNGYFRNIFAIESNLYLTFLGPMNLEYRQKFTSKSGLVFIFVALQRLSICVLGK